MGSKAKARLDALSLDDNTDRDQKLFKYLPASLLSVQLSSMMLTNWWLDDRLPTLKTIHLFLIIGGVDEHSNENSINPGIRQFSICM